MSHPSSDSVYVMDDIYRTTTTTLPPSSRNVLGTLKTFVTNSGGVNDAEEKESFLAEAGHLTRYAQTGLNQTSLLCITPLQSSLNQNSI